MKITSSTLFAALVMGLYLTVVSGRSIDEIIASSSTAVTNFDFLGDINGTVIRMELDMMLTVEQYNTLFNRQTFYNSNSGKTNRRIKRKAIKSLASRWTNKEIPYIIDSSAFSSREQSTIFMAMKEWESNTCITFRKATSSDSSFIQFEDGSGCSSYIGTGKGKRPISLAEGCREKGVIAHEIGHAVGFYHEQNRPDRDDYIIIKKENIVHPDLYNNFQKYPSASVSTYNVPYDYKSIMHYGGKAFSGNGEYTIQTIDPAFQEVIGNREMMSFLDIKLANFMYNCNTNCKSTVRCPKEGFVGKDCTCWCPGNPVKKCDGSGTSGITDRPLAKTTIRNTVKPTIRPTQRPASLRPAVCTDIISKCASWAKAGYCQTSSYVQTYCKLSCSAACTSRPVITTNTCRDSREHCQYWGSRGFCYGTYESFMNRNCPESCGLCVVKRMDKVGVTSSHVFIEETSSPNSVSVSPNSVSVSPNSVSVSPNSVSVSPNSVSVVSSSYLLILCAALYSMSRSHK